MCSYEMNTAFWCSPSPYVSYITHTRWHSWASFHTQELSLPSGLCTSQIPQVSTDVGMSCCFQTLFSLGTWMDRAGLAGKNPVSATRDTRTNLPSGRMILHISCIRVKFPASKLRVTAPRILFTASSHIPEWQLRAARARSWEIWKSTYRKHQRAQLIVLL